MPGRSPLAFVVAMVIAGLGSCTCGGPPPALRVSVHYLDFEPGCIQVIASDADGGAPSPPATPLQSLPGDRAGELRVAVYRHPAWGPTLRVQVEARELDCEGPVVVGSTRDVDAWDGGTQAISFTLSAVDVDEDRYVSSPPGRDCADNDPARHPGAQEICDGLDQDCALGPDDGLGVGAACSEGSGCSGVVVCLNDGGTGCSVAGGLHPDQDGDGAGAPGPATCAAQDGGSFVANENDCDDGDPFSALGLKEICDRRDNDCDGRVDRSADGGNPCPTSPSWVDYSEGGGNHDWHSVWSWADGGVWIASVTDNHFSQKLPQSATFADQTCGSAVWRGIWADPRTGVAYAVGDGMKMLVNRGASGCIDRSSIANTPGEPRAVMGFPKGDAGVELYVVGGLGDTARWDGGGGVEALDPASPRLYDIHGTSPANLFAVGFDPGPGAPKISRFVPPRFWSSQVLPPAVASSGDLMSGVHVVNERLAYAVT
ncbi:MAG TPA: putative metal-binding motif-containing protein, partial [Myxococcales bacterium]|nr:putative metal-binding motif-containing protein [Myxococcales bacterium]